MMIICHSNANMLNVKTNKQTFFQNYTAKGFSSKQKQNSKYRKKLTKC